MSNFEKITAAPEALVSKGRTQWYRIKHAEILLKLDEIPENEEWTYAQIKEAYHATPHTISQIAKRFVTGGGVVHPKTEGGVCSADGGRSGCIPASL